MRGTRGRDQRRCQEATHPLKGQGFFEISDRATTGDVSSGVWLVTPGGVAFELAASATSLVRIRSGIRTLATKHSRKEWLDENCRDRVLKKAALEQSASDAAKRLFHPRAWV